MARKETFLARWSRLKKRAIAEATEQALRPAAPPMAGQAVRELPPLDSLDFSSDFSAFVRPDIEEGVKRQALKKLFHTPHFNEMDGLDVYIDDYNTFEPIPEEMLRQLEHTRDLLVSHEARREDAGKDAGAAHTLPQEGDQVAAAAPPRPRGAAPGVAALPPGERSAAAASVLPVLETSADPGSGAQDEQAP